MRTFATVGPIPGAVHGKYVPGLPWDPLPAPVWELDEGETDPLVEEIRTLNGAYGLAFEDEQNAEDDASAARSRQRELREEIDQVLEAIAKSNPRLAADLKSGTRPVTIISIALAGFPPLPNETRRMHWAERNAEAQTWRHAAKMTALQALREHSHPEDFPLTRARIELAVIRPTGTGPDADNAVGAVKPILDGVCDAGVLASDARRHVRELGVHFETGPVGLRLDVVTGSVA